MPVLGCDVSAIQGHCDWERAKAAGVSFVWSKCTEGNEPKRNDPLCKENIVAARDAGLFVGTYHFAYPLSRGVGNAPQEQAARAYSQSLLMGMGQGTGELPPLFDIEWPAPENWVKWNITAKSISQWSKEFCEASTKLWNKKPVIYTYPYFWQSLARIEDVSWAGAYDLNIAHYKHLNEWLPPAESTPLVPRPWKEWKFWQFSADRGLHLPGIRADVDRVVFRGDHAELAAYCGAVDAVPTRPSGGVVLPEGLPISGTDTASLTAALRKDDRGLDTWLQTPRGLQIGLMALGFSVGVVDGYMGPKTKAAILNLQRALHLNPDGIVGPLTRRAMAKALRDLYENTW